MNSDVTDTFTYELWFCWMHFLRLFLAFIQKLCLLSFHVSKKFVKGGLDKSGGGGLENFSKVIKQGGTLPVFQTTCKKTHLFFFSSGLEHRLGGPLFGTRE